MAPARSMITSGTAGTGERMTSHTITKGMIVDDHPVVRTGIAGMLGDSSKYRIVCEARNGREAVEQYPVHRPDVTLMDLRMPEMDGATAASAIRRDFSSARSIIFSSYDGDENIYCGLRAGAKAFLLKSASKEEFLQAIETVCCGQMHISPDVATKLAKRMSVSELTSRETEVLTLVARGASNIKVGRQLYISEDTVKAHRNSILSKMEVSDRTQTVMEGVRRGMIFP